MPASMMIAVAGSILKVSESRNATAPTGPRPGNTPTRVPTSDPTKQKNRLVGVSATENPRATLVRMSTSDSQKTGGQRNAERDGEERVGNQRGGERDGETRHGGESRADARPASRREPCRGGRCRRARGIHEQSRGQKREQDGENGREKSGLRRAQAAER